MTMACAKANRVQIASLASGLTASVVLCLAVATDYWLHTTEPYDVTASMQAGAQDEFSTDENGPPIPAVKSGGPAVMIMLSTNSGLWRLCVYSADTLGENSEESESSETFNTCSVIAFLWQRFKRIDGGDTSISIVRSMRRATPVILLSAVLILVAEALSVAGYHYNSCHTLIGGVLFIVAALSLVLGQILYISAVNDEASLWKRPEHASETQKFSYHYGWSFYTAGSAFVLAMCSAVGQLTDYHNQRSKRALGGLRGRGGLGGWGGLDPEGGVRGLVMTPRLELDTNDGGGRAVGRNYSSVIF